ncbi:DUF4738 domain-containing protein [Prevotella sp. A2931]|uniref:DUF4738 domain-containing protein n=1 Tax=Prevotella illustrans TaxID=2800387 RepID=A0ABS3M5S5_9BACT|nr:MULTISPECIES: DUF4738 domain-containing protein [Prevotella]MBO1363529.1 DUF4738 domain-containing protein [Prevotella illustrans]PTL25998.1 DUF4738 domain-containing protein [Prevotella sp. oral taxon 820]
MNKFLRFSVTIFFVGCFLAFTGCHEKKKSDIIITHKSIKKTERTISKVGDYKQERDVEWLGTNYKVIVERKADSGLPIVDDGNGSKFYDNVITVTIKRKDGSQFFSRTFKKADFEDKVDDIYKKNSVLLGIVLDIVEGNRLVFAASVGSPDKMSDEYVPLVLKIDNLGGVAISKDSQLDTGSDRVAPTKKKSEAELSEEEGI